MNIIINLSQQRQVNNAKSESMIGNCCYLSNSGTLHCYSALKFTDQCHVAQGRVDGMDIFFHFTPEEIGAKGS